MNLWVFHNLSWVLLTQFWVVLSKTLQKGSLSFSKPRIWSSTAPGLHLMVNHRFLGTSGVRLWLARTHLEGPAGLTKRNLSLHQRWSGPEVINFEAFSETGPNWVLSPHGFQKKLTLFILPGGVTRAIGAYVPCGCTICVWRFGSELSRFMPHTNNPTAYLNAFEIVVRKWMLVWPTRAHQPVSQQSVFGKEIKQAGGWNTSFIPFFEVKGNRIPSTNEGQMLVTGFSQSDSEYIEWLGIYYVEE